MGETEPWLRNVVLFLGAQSLSMFGSNIVGYSIIWYVTLKTGSSGQYALLVIASSLAMAATTIPGGVWADRYWRKALMIGADAGVAVATALLAVLMLSGFESLALIAVVLALRGLGGGIQAPAVAAALPQITPVARLLRVNSVNQALQALIQVAAPALAAVLLVYVPLGWILMVDVATAVIGVGITLLIPIPRLHRDPDRPAPEGLRGYVAHLGEAFRYALAIPGLRRTLGVAVLVLTVVIPYAQMTPVFVVRLYGTAQWKLAATEIAFSLGMVAGGVVLAAWGGLRNRMTMIMTGTITLTVMTMVMGFMPVLAAFLVVMVIQGITVPVFNTPIITAVQELIPEAMMGRVTSLLTLASVVCGPIGMAVAGPLADRLDLSWMAFACGAAGLVVLVALVVRGGPGSRLMAPD